MGDGAGECEGVVVAEGDAAGRTRTAAGPQRTDALCRPLSEQLEAGGDEAGIVPGERAQTGGDFAGDRAECIFDAGTVVSGQREIAKSGGAARNHLRERPACFLGGNAPARKPGGHSCKQHPGGVVQLAQTNPGVAKGSGEALRHLAHQRLHSGLSGGGRGVVEVVTPSGQRVAARAAQRLEDGEAVGSGECGERAESTAGAFQQLGQDFDEVRRIADSGVDQRL